MHLDVATHSLVDGDISVRLTRSEFLIIAAMATGHLTSIDKIIHAIHGDEETDSPENVARVNIHKMRRKFRDAGLGPVICTVWGRGYKLESAVTFPASGPPPVVIPSEHRATLERLLFSHPDQAAADRVLASFVGG